MYKETVPTELAQSEEGRKEGRREGEREEGRERGREREERACLHFNKSIQMSVYFHL